jgi:hypothetical protein
LANITSFLTKITRFWKKITIKTRYIKEIMIKLFIQQPNSLYNVLNCCFCVLWVIPVIREFYSLLGSIRIYQNKVVSQGLNVDALGRYSRVASVLFSFERLMVFLQRKRSQQIKVIVSHYLWVDQLIEALIPFSSVLQYALKLVD